MPGAASSGMIHPDEEGYAPRVVCTSGGMMGE